jgi:hypothetical protein
VERDLSHVGATLDGRVCVARAENGYRSFVDDAARLAMCQPLRPRPDRPSFARVLGDRLDPPVVLPEPVISLVETKSTTPADEITAAR